MEYQDTNLKRQIFSKDKLRGELIVNSNDGFYLSGTSSGTIVRGLCFTEYLGDEYVFYSHSTRVCRRAKLLQKGIITSNASLTGNVVSSSLVQVIGGVTHTPGIILPALSIGKIYFASSVVDTLMEFDYDFGTHTFTFIQLITIPQGAEVADYSFVDNGSTLVVYRLGSTIRYYSLASPYNISSYGTYVQATSLINVACRPFFFNNGTNAYYYQYVLGSGQFDFCVAKLTIPYRINTATKRYGIAFNRSPWYDLFRPTVYPFTLNEYRNIISVPISRNGSMTHGVFTINGKFNKNLDVTIIP